MDLSQSGVSHSTLVASSTVFDDVVEAETDSKTTAIDPPDPPWTFSSMTTNGLNLKRPAASSIDELQHQIDGFVRYYNEQRPHWARGCPLMHAWRALDKATPTLAGQRLLAKTRVRHDRVDDTGCVTLRYRRTIHHVSLGRRYRGQRVIILMADLDVRVITEDGELIRHFTLNPSKNYQPRKDD